MQVIPTVATLPKPAVICQDLVVICDDAVAGKSGNLSIAHAALMRGQNRYSATAKGAIGLAVVIVETEIATVANLRVHQRSVKR
jgi:predicted house-cleaning NTP pyrophosphatase (Maf/HAM1 superfamily)